MDDWLANSNALCLDGILVVILSKGNGCQKQKRQGARDFGDRAKQVVERVTHWVVH